MSDTPCMLRHTDIRDARKRFRHPWNPNSEVILTQLAPLTGLERTGVSLVSIPPGKESFATHMHHSEEEWVYIISGSGTAEIGEGHYPVEAGDFMGFPPATVAHNLRNSGDEPLVYLMGGESLENEGADFPALGRRMVRLGQTIDVFDLEDGRPMDPFTLEEIGGEDAPD